MQRGAAAEAARGGAALAILVPARRNEAQGRWLARLGEHQARVRAWLAATRDPATRGQHATRQEAVRLASRAHALAAQGLVVRLAGDARWPLARARANPAPIAGGGDDAQVARLIERAAENQLRALSWVRRARDPSAHMAVAVQRREMLLRAIEHIATSRRLLYRAQTLSADGALDDVLARHLAQLDDASAMRGESTFYILFREILPSVLPALTVEAALRFSYSIFLVASLGFLGIGVQPPSPNWGMMVNEARDHVHQIPWSMYLPIAAISLLVISVNLMADSLRRILQEVSR